jgi:transcriptional regulator GlxA family with amidase domain
MKFEICLTEGSGQAAEPSYASVPIPEASAVSDCGIPGISKAIIKIHNEYSRPLTVTSLARECGMSVRTLHRLYRSVTGNTIGKDLAARRIQAAAELLRGVDVKLESVAIETGLHSAKNLCRLFKDHLGLTPGQWKESWHRQHTADHASIGPRP